jgi:hypothetical protein
MVIDGYPLKPEYAAACDAFAKEAKHELAAEINCIIAACDAYEVAKESSLLAVSLKVSLARHLLSLNSRLINLLGI